MSDGPNADHFIAHQESRASRCARCGEPVSWGLADSIESAAATLTTFPEADRDTEHLVRIPDDPEVLAAVMARMRARVLEQCEGSA